MTLPSNILLSMSEYLSDLGDLHQLPRPPHCSAPALPRPLAGITPALLLPRLAGGRSQDSSASTTEGTNCKSPQLDRQMDNCLPIPWVVSLVNPNTLFIHNYSVYFQHLGNNGLIHLDQYYVLFIISPPPTHCQEMCAENGRSINKKQYKTSPGVWFD